MKKWGVLTCFWQTQVRQLFSVTSVIRQFDCYSTSSIMLSMFLQSSMCTYHCICFSFSINKKGSPVHVAPTCAGSGEESDHLGLFVRSLSLHFCRRLVLGLEPVTSWSQGNSFTAALGLPLQVCVIKICSKTLDKESLEKVDIV